MVEVYNCLDVFPRPIGWPEAATLLVFMLCADAKERELFQIARVQEPTYIGYFPYLMLTTVMLHCFSTVHPEHPTHVAQLVGLCIAWIAFWVFHLEKIALVVFSKVWLLGLYMLIDTSSIGLVGWLAYLAFNVFAAWSFRNNTHNVRFPGRTVSRFHTPRAPGSNANALIFRDSRTLLLTQELDPAL